MPSKTLIWDGTAWTGATGGGPVVDPTDGYDLIVGWIQSNMRGAATDYSTALDAAPSNVYEWNWPLGLIVPAALPGSNLDGFPGMGVLTSFANDYAAAHPGRKVLRVNTARGGTGFTAPSTNTANGVQYTGLHWRHDLANNSNNLARIAVGQVHTILAAAPGSRIVAMLANHGSTDGSNNTSKANFKTYLQDWIAWMRTQLPVTGVPYVMMQMRPDLVDGETRHKNIDDAQAETAAEFSDVGYVLAPTDPSHFKADAVHFNAKGVREIGHRLYGKFVSMGTVIPDPDPEPGFGARPANIPAPIVGRPSGPGYIRYEDLQALAPAGATVSAVMEMLPPEGGIITFPEGVFRGDGFPGPGIATFLVPKRCHGIIGSGKGTVGSEASGTIFKINPNTSTYEAPIQGSSGPSQARVMFRIGGLQGGLFANFQIAGTEQKVWASQAPTPFMRTQPFHGFCDYDPRGRTIMQDVLITGWYGDSGAPPGETMGIQIHGKAGPPEWHGHITARVELDSRRFVGDVANGPAGITYQNTIGGYLIDCKAQYFKTNGFVAYQIFDTELFDCTWDQRTTPNQIVFNCANHERSDGITHYRPKFLRKTNVSGVHLSHSNDGWSANYDGLGTRPVTDGQCLIVDGTYSDIQNKIGKLYIQSWSPYTIGGMEVGGDSMVTPPAVRKADGVIHEPYYWSHITNQYIT